MDLNKYQQKCNRDCGVMYPKHNTGHIDAVEYCSLALCGEAGEIANKVKKIVRGDGPLDKNRKSAIKKEIGGALWYIAMLATELGFSLNDIAKENLELIADRLERGTIQGDGDDR